MDIFHEMGKDIETKWAATHFDTRTLPDLACDVLASYRPSEQVSPDDITAWIAAADTIPPQPNIDSNFGQPPITVYAHPRFYIEALHWTIGTTEIHQHGFSGAFCVLSGSSLQSTYTFHSRRRINVHMLLGDLVLRDVSLLRRGDVQPIRSGDSLIHSVFHLDYPSITLVIRTHTDLESKPQYHYMPPYLAIDPYYSDHLSQRRLQALEFLHRIDSPLFEPRAAAALGKSDPIATYTLLRAMADFCAADVMDRLLRVSKARWGDEAYRIWACVEESRRQNCLIRARERVKSADVRYLLALLLNVRSRDQIVAAVQARYPSRNPKDQLLELCFALSRSDAGVEFDELNKSLFACLFDGASVDNVLEHLRTQFDPSDVDLQRPEIVSQCGVLREASVFRYLLAEA